MIKLVRLDYRLLHGQVVFAWTGHVSAQRIIVVDDEAANDDLKKSVECGMNGHLSKPVEVDKLYRTLNQVIRGKGKTK